MARVFLLSATPPEEVHVENQGALEALRQKAMLDKFGAHSLTTDAESADLILFVESYGAGWHFERVRSHPLTRKYREKCFTFCSNPYVIPFLPGIYAGVAKRWASRRTISGFYLGLTENQFTTYTPASADLPYLFSFVGSTTTSGVRREIAALTHPRGLVRDTSADYDRVLHR